MYQVQVGMYVAKKAEPHRPPNSFDPFSEEPSRLFNLIGDIKASGIDVVSPNLKHISAIGDTYIDLTKISETHSTIRIESYTGIGDLRILVPPNTRVKKGLFNKTTS